ncbi:WcbI family polysaccharide biosynthesis putative acetyltransferase [Niveispirillum cyanobacteriorum]|uniref:Uncharacterized protein n=1 Tax=Niveispirillum cyanobacteriorum TaxID=1612173 RepID=A0A2K9NLK2_9PROT|nr:WcbI family polysaccharide biosynthesis putative acetyltransferase [Niveispirillum cyanobacteriorum]AUN33958.1 hypothetical protein C0V82_26520 [Niveispirillum cyanobacteriorum]GGE86840.1 hypothetical protein GCM10011317_49960 [Niveispirillum cyanobacteriorum]
MHNYADAAEPSRNVIIFANCHGWVIQQAIKKFAPDFNQYSAVHFIENFTDDYNKFLDTVRSCKVFLYQTEKGAEVERKFSTLSALLPPDARVIRFPMVGFNIFWPTQFRDYSAVPDPKSGKINFHFADRKIIHLWRKGLDADAIVEAVLSFAPVTPEDLHRSLELWMESYRVQEAECDVGIADIIPGMVLVKETFYWPTHCCNSVIFTMVDRILAKLGKAPLLLESAAMKNALHDWELPIHPAVVDAFNLDYAPPDRSYLMPDGRRLKLKEYLFEYIEYLPRRYPEVTIRADQHGD